MSDMEIYYGKFKVCERDDIPELVDEDIRYDYEDAHGILLVAVDDIIYEVSKVADIDPFGFSLNIEPSDEHRFIAYWYNGGAGVHEVIEAIIGRRS
jgi:hypothetical protein